MVDIVITFEDFLDDCHVNNGDRLTILASMIGKFLSTALQTLLCRHVGEMELWAKLGDGGVSEAAYRGG